MRSTPRGAGPRPWLVATGLVLVAISATHVQAQTGSVAGRVTDGRTGAPVPAAQVAIVGTSLGAIATAEGRFRIDNVPVGARAVRAIRIGYQPALAAVTVQPGARPRSICGWWKPRSRWTR
jgi:hypothetical protein